MLHTRLFLLAIAVVMASCEVQIPEGGSKPLKVGYMPISECLPVFVAKEMGFFDEHELDVELIPYEGGAIVMKSLLNGEVDVGFSNVVSLVLQRSEGSKFYSIYGATYETQRNQNHGLAVRKGEVSSIEDLRDSIIAVNTFNNIEALMLEKYLLTHGLKAGRDYELIQQAFPRMLSLLEADQIDAACLVEPFIAIAQHEGQDFEIFSNQYLSTTERTLVATYVTKESTLNRQKPEILAFRAAMTDAVKFIQENESRSREFVSLYTKIPDELVMKIGLPEFSDRINVPALDSIIADMATLQYLGSIPPPSAETMVWND